jgi:hypothetical protein
MDWPIFAIYPAKIREKYAKNTRGPLRVFKARLRARILLGVGRTKDHRRVFFAEKWYFLPTTGGFFAFFSGRYSIAVINFVVDFIFL